MLLVLGGALACFAGYRLFRIVLGDLRIHPRRDDRELGDGRQQHHRDGRGGAGRRRLSARSCWCSRISSASRWSAPASARCRARRVERLAHRRSAGAVVIIVLAIAGAIAAMFLQRYVIIVGDRVRRRVDDDRRRARDRRRSRPPRSAAAADGAGFLSARRRRWGSAGCRPRGSCSGWSARPCSWASRDGREK